MADEQPSAVRTVHRTTRPSPGHGPYLPAGRRLDDPYPKLVRIGPGTQGYVGSVGAKAKFTRATIRRSNPPNDGGQFPAGRQVPNLDFGFIYRISGTALGWTLSRGQTAAVPADRQPTQVIAGLGPRDR